MARYFLSDPELAAELLIHYVDSGVVSLIDLTRLRCESPISVDKNLKQVIGDLRFSTVFKQTEQQSNVFVFYEHQSTKDDLIAFRALEQIVKAYREFIDTAEPGGGRPRARLSSFCSTASVRGAS